MQFYYSKYHLKWSDEVFSQNWASTHNLGIFTQNNANDLTHCIGVMSFRIDYDLTQNMSVCYLLDFSIKPKMQHKGIGFQSLKLFESLIKLQNIHALHLKVMIDNPALKLYEKYGFTKIAQQGVYIQMQKVVNQL